MVRWEKGVKHPVPIAAGCIHSKHVFATALDASTAKRLGWVGGLKKHPVPASSEVLRFLPTPSNQVGVDSRFPVTLTMPGRMQLQCLHSLQQQKLRLFVGIHHGTCTKFPRTNSFVLIRVVCVQCIVGLRAPSALFSSHART